MKKFKEFQIVTPNMVCFNLCSKYALSLGYKDMNNLYDGFTSGLWLGIDGQVSSLEKKMTRQPVITLDEFFALTPEDVVLGPKRVLWEFENQTEGVTEWFARRLTQDQIDRIKAIMEES